MFIAARLRRLMFLVFSLFVSFYLLSVQAVFAQSSNIYGLVIGIDDYLGTQNDLAGAANDANDIELALKRAGARQVYKFLNTEAVKANIRKAWKHLVAQANAGDTIIFTFSGHGSQEKEPAGRNGETDGLNENFLLAGFGPSGPNTNERIVDDELFLWAKEADDKGVKVILVADSCHSGTMHRVIKQKSVRYRKGKFRDIQNDQLVYPSTAIAQLNEDDLKHFTFIGATTDDRLTPEITIGGHWRGALSWSFARALEGLADRDGNGLVSQYELLNYIVPAVRAHVENQQSPQISPLRANSDFLFPVTFASASQATPISLVKSQTGGNRGSTFSVLRVAVTGGTGKNLSEIKGVEIVENESDADIVWKVSEGIVEHRIGGMVAENVDQEAARYVVNKWAAIKFLKSKMLSYPVKMSLPRGDHRYKVRELVEIEITDVNYPYVTLFNLPPDGKVEFFLPRPNRPREATKRWSGRLYKQKFRVSNPPYGAEHLVAIYSKEVLNGLHVALRGMKTAKSAQALRNVLEEALGRQDVQVGVLSIYTGR